MLKLVHKIASYGPVYDSIQTAAGITHIYRHFQDVLNKQPTYDRVLDIGGGTGRIRNFLSPACKYWCLDNEMPKLAHFRRRSQAGFAVMGDAARLPVASASVDLVLCINVSHHLDDRQLNETLSEIRRVLRPMGRLLFFDPVMRKRWIPGRLLWSLDCGSYPRRKEDLLKIVHGHMKPLYQEDMRLIHEYVLLIAAAGPSGSHV